MESDREGERKEERGRGEGGLSSLYLYLIVWQWWSGVLFVYFSWKLERKGLYHHSTHCFHLSKCLTFRLVLGMFGDLVYHRWYLCCFRLQAGESQGDLLLLLLHPPPSVRLLYQVLFMHMAACLQRGEGIFLFLFGSRHAALGRKTQLPASGGRRGDVLF